MCDFRPATATSTQHKATVSEPGFECNIIIYKLVLDTERLVGEVIKESGIPREKIFITSKLR